MSLAVDELLALQRTLDNLRKKDAHITHILAKASQVWLSQYVEVSSTEGHWASIDVEGPLFMVRRDEAPIHQVIVLNTKTRGRHVIDITDDVHFSNNKPHFNYMKGLDCDARIYAVSLGRGQDASGSQLSLQYDAVWDAVCKAEAFVKRGDPAVHSLTPLASAAAASLPGAAAGAPSPAPRDHQATDGVGDIAGMLENLKSAADAAGGGRAPEAGPGGRSPPSGHVAHAALVTAAPEAKLMALLSNANKGQKDSCGRAAGAAPPPAPPGNAPSYQGPPPAAQPPPVPPPPAPTLLAQLQQGQHASMPMAPRPPLPNTFQGEHPRAAGGAGIMSRLMASQAQAAAAAGHAEERRAALRAALTSLLQKDEFVDMLSDALERAGFALTRRTA